MGKYLNAPARCDVCEGEFGKDMYDARTHSGQWGNLCKACWREHTSMRLGTGMGQHYQRVSPKDDWLKVAG